MTDDDALYALDLRLRPTVLTDLQELVFRYSWAGKSYAEMAELSGYDADYLKDVGSRLWKLLSQTLGLRVAKSNLQSVFHSALNPMLDGVQGSGSLEPPVEAEFGRTGGGQSAELLSSAIGGQASDRPAVTVAVPEAIPAPPMRVDWGEAMEVYRFYGREAELQTLSQWIGVQRCRLVAVLGMGGMGKSALAIRFVETAIATRQFQQVIWRSLRNAPLIDQLLIDLIQVLSDQQETQSSLPTQTPALIQALIQHCQRSRCLIILDNAETILQQEYGIYSQLLQQLAEARHQSCILITSREKPATVALLEGAAMPVRSLLLRGLDVEQGQAIFAQRANFAAAPQDWATLVEKYAGNPLALKILACAIAELFDCNVTKFVQFIQTQPLVFDDIQDLLDRQFDRLTEPEQEVMIWLAINREWVSLAELQVDLLSSQSQRRLPETVQSLVRKSLIETQDRQFTQQPVVMEYVTGKIIAAMTSELANWNPDLEASEFIHQFIHRYPIIKVTSQDSIKNSQIRVLLQPILAVLQETMVPESALTQMLAQLRIRLRDLLTYSIGNLINLLRASNADFTGFDFSHLCLWQADLQSLLLHRVSVQAADLSRSSFSEALGGVLEVAFLPDGLRLVSGDTLGRICLWNHQTRQLLHIFDRVPGWVTSVAVSPDGQYLATAVGDIKIWQIETQQCIQTLNGHSDWWIRGLTFSADGERLSSSSGGADQTVRLWDWRRGTCLQVIAAGHHTFSAAFSPDGRTIAVPQDDQTFALWDVLTKTCLRTFTGHDQAVASTAFSPDGKILASAGTDRCIKLWQVETGDCLHTLSGHRDQIWHLCFSPDGNTIASAGLDNTARLWQVQTGQCLRTLEGFTAHVYGIDFSRDGRWLATGSMDNTIRIWDMATSGCHRLWQGYQNAGWHVQFLPSVAGYQLASAGYDGVGRIWHLSQRDDGPMQVGDRVKTLRGHAAWMRSMVPLPSLQCDRLFTCGNDGIRLWDLSTQQCLKRLIGHQGPVNGLALTHDGKHLISGSFDYTAKLWDVQTGDCLHTFRGHENWVCALAMHPTEPLFVTASSDGTAKVWDLQQRSCIRTLTADQTMLFTMALSRDGAWVILAAGDRDINIWETATGKVLHTLTGHAAWVCALAVSPDGRWLASGAIDNTVRLWDLQTLTCVHVLQRHSQYVLALAFSPDGRWVASSGNDEMIYLWDVVTGEWVRSLQPEKLYAGLNITNATGLTPAQRLTLVELGAVDLVSQRRL